MMSIYNIWINCKKIEKKNLKKGNLETETRMLEMERIRGRILHENKECVLSYRFFKQF